MHVLIIPSGYPTKLFPVIGGFFRTQAVALASSGIKVGVIYPDLLNYNKFRLSNLFSHRYQCSFFEDEGIPTLMAHGFKPPFLGGWLFVQQTKRLIAAYIDLFGRPDLIHAHMTFWGGVAAASINERLGIPYIITEHASSFALNQIQFWQKPIIIKVLRKAAKLLAVSNSLAHDLRSYTLGKTVHIVPNVVNTNYFTPPAQKRSRRPFVFLATASLQHNKGIDILLKAFARAFINDPNAMLKIGGDGPERESLQKLAISLGVADRVGFLGQLSQEQVRNSMWRANAFLLTSFIETFGVVLIEALATDLPVIATKCGGPEEFVTSDMGYLVERGNVEQLAAKMTSLYANYDKFEGQKMLFNKKIENQFGFHSVASQLIKHYQDVLK